MPDHTFRTGLSERHPICNRLSVLKVLIPPTDPLSPLNPATCHHTHCIRTVTPLVMARCRFPRIVLVIVFTGVLLEAIYYIGAFRVYI